MNQRLTWSRATICARNVPNGDRRRSCRRGCSKHCELVDRFSHSFRNAEHCRHELLVDVAYTLVLDVVSRRVGTVEDAPFFSWQIERVSQRLKHDEPFRRSIPVPSKRCKRESMRGVVDQIESDEVSASVSRAMPESTRPVNSDWALGSALSWPIATRLSRGREVIDIPNQRQRFSAENIFHERVLLLTAVAKLLRSVERGVNSPADSGFNGTER